MFEIATMHDVSYNIGETKNKEWYQTFTECSPLCSNQKLVVEKWKINLEEKLTSLRQGKLKIRGGDGIQDLTLLFRQSCFHS